MPSVSVIIPVYNAEKYIERCARSLFEQTLEDIEYIFVNDCSLDESIQILDQTMQYYPHRRSQVKVISHQANMGQAKTRLTGMQLAKGEYVIHCDSDDWVDSALYEKMYSIAKSNELDVVVCDLLLEKVNTRDLRIGTRAGDVNTFILNLLFQKNPVSLCNKLIKRSLYSFVTKYPTNDMGEDMAIVLQIVKFCKTLSYIQDAYYHYDCTTMSITRRDTKAVVLSRAIQACKNVDLAVAPYKDSQEDKIQAGITHLKFNQRKHFMPIINYLDVYKLWRNTFQEINTDVLFTKKVLIPTRDRITFFLTLLGILPLIKKMIQRNIIC